MGKYILILLLTLLVFQLTGQSFKQQQKRYPRVRAAYADKGDEINKLLCENTLRTGELRLYIRVFKVEKILEVWGKNASDSVFSLIKQIDICNTSGRIGPKRCQGDLQIPEGFYHIDRFNPYSNFYLSLGINYPNYSDRILGCDRSPGGDIFIHGACVTIGCIPITNNYIKALYLLCVEAKNAGQKNIPVTIFPRQLSKVKYEVLVNKHSGNQDNLGLWADLKKGFDIFNQTKQLPNIRFINDGRHAISE